MPLDVQNKNKLKILLITFMGWKFYNVKYNLFFIRTS